MYQGLSRWQITWKEELPLHNLTRHSIQILGYYKVPKWRAELPRNNTKGKRKQEKTGAKTSHYSLVRWGCVIVWTSWIIEISLTVFSGVVRWVGRDVLRGRDLGKLIWMSRDNLDVKQKCGSMTVMERFPQVKYGSKLKFMRIYVNWKKGYLQQMASSFYCHMWILFIFEHRLMFWLHASDFCYCGANKIKATFTCVFLLDKVELISESNRFAKEVC